MYLVCLGFCYLLVGACFLGLDFCYLWNSCDFIWVGYLCFCFMVDYFCVSGCFVVPILFVLIWIWGQAGLLGGNLLFSDYRLCLRCGFWYCCLIVAVSLGFDLLVVGCLV